MAAPPVDVVELKRKGNEAFANKEFTAALEQYRTAIDALESSEDAPDRNVLLAQLHANSSAAELELKNYAEALKHASSAVSAQPNWPKAYLRKAAVLTAMGKPRDAYVSLKVAEALDPSAAIVNMRKKAEAAADAVDVTEPIGTPLRFQEVFRYLKNPRLKLATLAHAWNMLTTEERFGTLREFLRIVGGAKAIDESLAEADRPVPHISGFKKADLHPLPLDNYADITVPANWLTFFESLASAPAEGGSSTKRAASTAVVTSVPARVGLLRNLWDLCSPVEQGMIVEDIRSFYGYRADTDKETKEEDAGEGKTADGSDGSSASARPLGEWGSIRGALERLEEDRQQTADLETSDGATGTQ